MDIHTPYGICKNIDLEHLEVYNTESNCYKFSDPIVYNGEDSYLLFGFEVWEDDNSSFHFFVEEGLPGGHAETYKIDLTKSDQEYIKKLYYDYLKKNKLKVLKRDDILAIFEGLSHSQGFYGRLLRTLREMQEDDPSAYEEYMQDLENQAFTDPVELIIYIEE